MTRSLGYLTLVVREYDEAIAYFTTTLGFELVEDTPLGGGKRWVLVAPAAASGCRLLLAKAKNTAEAAVIGRQAAGRVFLFLHTDDFWRDHRVFSERGVEFCEPPRVESYGIVAVFRDLYGNRWDLLQLTAAGSDRRAGGT